MNLSTELGKNELQLDCRMNREERIRRNIDMVIKYKNILVGSMLLSNIAEAKSVKLRESEKTQSVNTMVKQVKDSLEIRIRKPFQCCKQRKFHSEPEAIEGLNKEGIPLRIYRRSSHEPIKTNPIPNTQESKEQDLLILHSILKWV